jgi:hypothetical protein
VGINSHFCPQQESLVGTGISNQGRAQTQRRSRIWSRKDQKGVYNKTVCSPEGKKTKWSAIPSLAKVWGMGGVRVEGPPERAKP